MTYKLKIKNQETKKETTYTIENLNQFKVILEKYKEELIEVELHSGGINELRNIKCSKS